MAYPEGIVFAFLPFGKTGNTLVDPVGVELIASARKNFMAVSLMSHIPYQLVVGGIEYVVKGNGKFHYSEARPEMAPVNRNRIDNVLPKVLANQVKVLLRYLPQVGRKTYSLEVFSGIYFHCESVR